MGLRRSRQRGIVSLDTGELPRPDRMEGMGLRRALHCRRSRLGLLLTERYGHVLFQLGEEESPGGVAGDVAHVLEEAEEGGEAGELPPHRCRRPARQAHRELHHDLARDLGGRRQRPSPGEELLEVAEVRGVAADGEGRATAIATQVVEEHRHRAFEGKVGYGRCNGCGSCCGESAHGRLLFYPGRGRHINASFGEEVQACKQDSGAVGLCHRLIGPLVLSLLGALACEIEVEWAGKPDSSCGRGSVEAE